MPSGLAQYGGEAPVEQDPSRKHVVEAATHLPDSVIWKLLANYYKMMACEAWTDNYVPMFVTSNSRFAKHYAMAFFYFMKDWFKIHPTHGPVYIIEIGGGHGRFSFLFLRHLLRLRPLWEGFAERPFVFVFSDVAERNNNFVRHHPAMQEFIRDGWLDFALFDANVGEKTENIFLQIAGREIPRGTPIAIVANYVLDSLCADGYQLRRVNDNVHYYRARLTVYSPMEEADPADPAVITRMTLGWDWEEFAFPVDDEGSAPLVRAESPLASMNAYREEEEYMSVLLEKQRKRFSDSQPRVEVAETSPLAPPPEYLVKSKMMQSVVKSYATNLDNIPGYDVVSVVLPIGAMQLVEWLRVYTNDKLMVMIGDKGYADASEFRGYRPPHIAIHGSISFMVNLDAIKKFVQTAGGFSFSSPFRDTFQITFSFCLGKGRMLLEIPCVTEWATLNIAAIVPDVLIAWQRQCQDDFAADRPVSLKTLIALMRYSEHDPDVFQNMRKQFIAACVTPLCGARLEADMQGDLQLIASHWYKLRKNEDVADGLAQLAMKTGRLATAAAFFRRSLDEVPEGRHAATFVNMAACYKSLGNFAEAKKAVEQALEMSQNYGPALSLREQILACQDPLSVCLVGNSAWITKAIGPSLARDQRVKVKAVFAFSKQNAEALAASVRTGTDCRLLWGSLDRILDADDIDGIIMDLPPGLTVKVIEKISRSAKTLLIRSPLGLNGDEAQTSILSWAKSNKSVFHAACASRNDETIIQAGARARDELGGVQCVIATRTLEAPEFDMDVFSWVAHGAAELIGAVSVIVDGEAGGTAAVAAAKGASGWLDFAQSKTKRRIQCSFTILEGEPGMTLQVLCARGFIQLTLSANYAWRIDESGGKTGGATADGLSNCLDNWITSTRRSKVPCAEAPTAESLQSAEPEELVVHRSLRDAVGDALAGEAILKSIKKEGSPMEFVV